jgi:CDP-diacylglycerol---glycerol-3-phosphate 3-phosphatidyltransferase
MKINNATKITLLRIALIPIVLLVLMFPYKGEASVMIDDYRVYLPYLIAAFIFMLASFTDALDGYLARTTNSITNIGKFLDPIADKLLVNSLLIYLAYVHNINVLLVIIMIARDIIVDALRMIAMENNRVISASIWGKLKTVFQMALIVLILLFSFPNKDVNMGLVVLSYITTIISVVSGIDYLIKNRGILREDNKE